MGVPSGGISSVGSLGSGAGIRADGRQTANVAVKPLGLNTHLMLAITQVGCLYRIRYNHAMITKPIRVTPQLAPQQRARGRPKLGDCRVECVVPKAVYDRLVAEEQAGHGYRTRVAAGVLCDWANV
jgi:hypothetical protein